jgi:hypothetical protein
MFPHHSTWIQFGSIKSPKTRASNGLGFEPRLPALGYSLPAFELLPCLSLLGTPLFHAQAPAATVAGVQD